MSEDRKRVKVEIYGSSYTIVSNHRKEQIEQLAETVDKRMKAIALADPRLSLSHVAVLAALTLAEDNWQLERQNQRLTGMLEREWDRKKKQLVKAPLEDKGKEEHLAGKAPDSSEKPISEATREQEGEKD